MVEAQDMDGAVNVLMYEARHYGALFPHIGEAEFVQEGMVGLLESQKGYNPHMAKFSTYAHARIRWRILERIRRDKPMYPSRYGRARGDTVQQMYPSQDADASAETWLDGLEGVFHELQSQEEALEREELLAQLRIALESLTEKERRLVGLVLEGKTFREAGETMGFSKQYAHQRYLAVIARLRREFGIDES